MNIANKDSYTDDDLDEALDCVIDGIEVMNNKELMKMVITHAKKKGKQLEAIKEFSGSDSDDGKITSIQDLRDKKYEAFQEETPAKVKSIADIKKKSDSMEKKAKPEARKE